MKQPDWDYDLGYGQEGEHIAQAWHAGKRETKRKSRLDPKFYVELEQNPFGTGWRPSGLATTHADYAEWVIGNTGVVFACPMTRIRTVLAGGLGYPVEERDGTCPTRGRILSWKDMVSDIE